MSSRRTRLHSTAPVLLAAAGLAAAALAVPAGSVASAAPPGHPSPTASPELTARTFADPPTSVRPKYRWWVPLAYTEDGELESELQQMKDAGAGGAEVAAFSVEGSGNNTNPFLETYGWGTPRWAEKTRVMMKAARDRDLSLDLTISPRWPATVPTVADVNDAAAAQQIAFATEFHKGGTGRTGALPRNLSVTVPSGARTSLIAAVVAKCEDAACASQSAKPKLLDRSSVVDVTQKVDGTGNLDLTFEGDANSTYALIAFYQLPTGQSLSGYTPTGTNYVLDTLSVEGAKATTDFYDASILTPDVRKLLSQLRSADFYEDSLEIGTTQKWTSDFVAEWTKRRGYSPVTVLPALAGAGDQGITSKPAFDFADGSGARVRTDYRQTWSDLYIANRLEVLREWANRHHMQTRVQTYGGPIDITEASGHVDVPEGESLAFGQSVAAYSNVEDYKVVASGAHLAGSPVVSDECCAFSNQVWASTVADATERSNLQAVYRGFAGGVNQIVWHGFPYLNRGPAGAGQQSTWPGMTYGGNTSWSEAFGSKNNPSWSDYRPVNDHLARMQMVLRQGKPRFDLAVYRHDFGLNGTGTTGTGSDKILPSSSATAAAGYTYEYLSPAQLRSKDARYEHGALFPGASAYQAVLLDEQDTMPVDTAERLLALARRGLPVVVVGDLPTSVPGLDHGGSEDAELRRVVAGLIAQRSVVRVDDERKVPAALERLRVAPAAAASVPSADVLAVRRHASAKGDSSDYYYLWNQTGARAHQTMTLAGDGTPYRLNTWTGEITPITEYERHRGGVTLDVDLAAHDADVVVLTERRDGTFHGRGRTGADGTSKAGRGADPVDIASWDLTVDGWSPGASGLPGDTAHTQLGPVAIRSEQGEPLPAWTSITPENGFDADLGDVSGVGTYTTSFRLGEDWRRVREAQLDLGRAVDTVSITINGKALPPVDQADLAHIEVGKHLRVGENTISVRVASTLLNAVRVAPGTGASGRAKMDYGLLGPVRLTPTSGADPYLLVEPMERAVPLASGASNRARFLVTNRSSRPVGAEVEAAAPAGVTATPPSGKVTVPAGDSRVVEVVVRHDTATDDSRLGVTVAADNGARGEATVTLNHTTNLAVNTDGAPFPALLADASQDRYPAHLAVDGDAATFAVSYGRAAGQGPTPERPWHIGVDLGLPAALGSVTVGGRSLYGSRDYTLEVSDDGSTWRTVATVVDAAKEGSTIELDAVKARYVRARVTRAWDNGTDANVQMSELEVHAP
ncbi:glycosyl hydrolase [Mumia qirimensis]|uniref:glycosyl hydrolase n=1 Tax=Mumia qirimensis TaxID=3234852 RepID=UPI00351CDE4F